MELIVQPVKEKDAGRGLAMVNEQVLDRLGVRYDDYVVVEGTSGRRAVARTWSGGTYADTPNDCIRIDGRLRAKADASIDERVTVEPAEVRVADSITVAVPEGLRIRGDLGPYVRDKLTGQATKVGETLHLSVTVSAISSRSGETIPMRVVDSGPEGYVVITQETEVVVSDTYLEDLGTEPGTVDVETQVSYEDIGGLERELEQVREMIELPMRQPELFQQLGIEPPKGVLLHGPPGTGKTLLSRAISNEVDAYLETISGPEIVSEYYGESEEELREVFEEAEEEAPAIVFIDEIDSLAPKRGDASGDVERRIVAQLLALMDGLEGRGQVTVMAATNRPDAIDPALRRGGRFDREIEIGVPDEGGRKEILQVHTRGMPLAEDVDLDDIAERAHGFVGADLESLAREAAMHALQGIRPAIDFEDEFIDARVLHSLEVTREDFRQALTEVGPSGMREFVVQVPDVTWDDVGGLESVEEQLRKTVQWPIEHPEAFEVMDMEPARGVLLYGPPGTGKTLLAKAVANETRSNFISIKGPEVLDKFIGESEESIREVFAKARENAPTVVFFDEIDALATQRGSGGSADNDVSDRVVSQLLTELDGLETLDDVVVIAATNRPDMLDQALMRPGRLDRHVHVSVPDRATRRAIFEVHTRDKPIADDVNVDRLARRTEGYVGTDVEAVCREAAMAATEAAIEARDPDDDFAEALADVEMSSTDFDRALEEVNPSVTEEVRKRYAAIEERYDSAEPAARDGDRGEGRAFH